MCLWREGHSTRDVRACSRPWRRAEDKTGAELLQPWTVGRCYGETLTLWQGLRGVRREHFP